MSVRILYVYAVDQERIVLPEMFNVDYLMTGIGKCNAAYALTRRLCMHPEAYDMVLNIGTAGTLRFQVGDILFCNRFVDRDLEKLKDYGLTYGVDSLYDGVCLSHVGEDWIERGFIVNTGDDFVTSSQLVEGDVVDMEAYALAFVCQQMGVPFASVKYVTDEIGKNSLKHWEDKLSDARKGLSLYFEKMVDYGFGKY